MLGDLPTTLATDSEVAAGYSVIGHTHPPGALSVPEYQTDPASPAASDMWVLAPRHSAGLAMGALGMTYSNNDGFYYDLSFRTAFGETKRVRMS